MVGNSEVKCVKSDAGAKVFAKELYDAKLLSEEGWKRVEEADSPKVLTH